jgi:hypothetical protein
VGTVRRRNTAGGRKSFWTGLNASGLCGIWYADRTAAAHRAEGSEKRCFLAAPSNDGMGVIVSISR